MSGVIMIFAKAPVAGTAKTRLIPALGAEGAARLQAKLLTRTVAMACAQSDHPVALWCVPDPAHEAFQACHAEYGAALYPQQGSDLGARMAHAFAVTLANHEWALVIGTDCPHLTTETLLLAGKALAGGEEAVLGPAADGGYYLLGLRHPRPSLFVSMAWGSDGVLEESRRRLRESGIHPLELPLLHDLDRPEDLRLFPPLLQEIEGRP